jgi:hypothetical protein
MEENPYRAPDEPGATVTSDHRRIFAWCAWAMLAIVVLINVVMTIVVTRGN